MHPKKQALIDHLDAARAHLNRALSQIVPGSEIYPTWHLKEMLDHLAGWDDAIIAALDAHARGDTVALLAPYGIDHYNAQTVETRQTLPLERTKQEFEKTRLKLKQMLIDLPDEKMDLTLVTPWGQEASVEGMIEVFVHHEHEHAQDIETTLLKADQQT